MNTISYEIPIKTVSEANCSENRFVKSKRHKKQQFFTRLAFMKHVKGLTLPCLIKFTRFSPLTLDDDNLPMAFKWIRDEIADCIFPEKTGVYFVKRKDGSQSMRKIKGRGDSDPRIKWSYAQEKRAKQGIRIEISYGEEDQMVLPGSGLSSPSGG